MIDRVKVSHPTQLPGAFTEHAIKVNEGENGMQNTALLPPPIVLSATATCVQDAQMLKDASNIWSVGSSLEGRR